MEDLRDMGEKKIVDSLIQMFDPNRDYLLGDDCAVLDLGKDYLLITTDIINQKTHIPDGANPGDIGWHVAAVNLSDIAAMGGRPLGVLFAFGVPPETTWETLEKISLGIRDYCAGHAIPVLGGDTKESEVLTISGTAVGIISKGRTLWRRGAKPGDLVAITGRLGRMAQWKRDRDPSQLLKIKPRIREGLMMGESGAVTSCIDISDGLSTSLYHLSKASQTGFDIDFESIPMVEGLTSREKEEALHDGGDYELLFTVDPDKAEKVFNIDRGDTSITKIGVVTDEMEICIIRDGKRECLQDEGYEHFGGSR
jgi:thiamine-monophosphate kinase